MKSTFKQDMARLSAKKTKLMQPKTAIAQLKKMLYA
jgi:hypothetical protein